MGEEKGTLEVGLIVNSAQKNNPGDIRQDAVGPFSRKLQLGKDYWFCVLEARRPQGGPMAARAYDSLS